MFSKEDLTNTVAPAPRIVGDIIIGDFRVTPREGMTGVQTFHLLTPIMTQTPNFDMYHHVMYHKLWSYVRPMNLCFLSHSRLPNNVFIFETKMESTYGSIEMKRIGKDWYTFEAETNSYRKSSELEVQAVKAYQAWWSFRYPDNKPI